MGILDDAIREHLELKRRRGTDPTEIDRLEREALGPVRRSPREVSGASAVEDPTQDVVFRDEDAELPEAWSPTGDERPFVDQEPELLEVDEIEEWESPARGLIQGGISVEPDSAAPATPAPPYPGEAPPVAEPIEPDPYLEQETVEHDVEADQAEASGKGDMLEEKDDMLEETPEFLQDTPDHDRLWFEQRPPRDFDLDR